MACEERTENNTKLEAGIVAAKITTPAAPIRRHINGKGERERGQGGSTAPWGEGTQGHPSTALQVRKGPEAHANVAEAVISPITATAPQSTGAQKSMGMTRKHRGGTRQMGLGVDFFGRGRADPCRILSRSPRSVRSIR